MPETAMKRLAPLWSEALQAFLADATYSVEMARAGAAISRPSPTR